MQTIIRFMFSIRTAFAKKFVSAMLFTKHQFRYASSVTTYLTQLLFILGVASAIASIVSTFILSTTNMKLTVGFVYGILSVIAFIFADVIRVSNYLDFIYQKKLRYIQRHKRINNVELFNSTIQLSIKEIDELYERIRSKS